MKILRVDGSMRRNGSISRQLTDELINHLVADAPNAEVKTRDLADPLPHVTEDWMNANFTDEADRTPAQNDTLTLSESLVEELEEADTIVIGVPI